MGRRTALLVAWSEGWQPTDAEPAFVKWTRWTVAAATQITVNFSTCIIAAHSELRQVLFLVPSVCGFLFVYEISRGTAAQICAKVIQKMCLVPRSYDFDGQCPQGQKWHFLAFLAACTVLFMFGKTSLASGCYYFCRVFLICLVEGFDFSYELS